MTFRRVCVFVRVVWEAACDRQPGVTSGEPNLQKPPTPTHLHTTTPHWVNRTSSWLVVTAERYHLIMVLPSKACLNTGHHSDLMPWSLEPSLNFFCKHCFFEGLLFSKKSKKHKYMSKCMCTCLCVCVCVGVCVFPPFISISMPLHLQAHLSIHPYPCLCIYLSVFLAHARSSDRGFCPVSCWINCSIRLQKPSWSSG